MSSLRVTAVAIVAMVAAPLRADANPALDRAREALDELEYRAAYDALDEALEAGTNTRAEMIEIYRLRGEVAASLGNTDDAVRAFESLLALDPDARLADGVSPKIGKPFATARRKAADRGALALDCEITAHDPTTVVVTARQNQLGLAVTGILGDDDDAAGKRLTRGRATIEASEGTEPTTVGLADAAGNHLATSSVFDCKDTSSVILDEPKPEPKPDSGGSILGHWALWGGVAVALGATGTYFGLETRSDVDELNEMYANSGEYQYADVQAVEDRAHRNALYANIAFGAAGAAAIASGVLWLTRDTGDGEPENRDVVVAPTWGAHDVGFAVAVPF